MTGHRVIRRTRSFKALMSSLSRESNGDRGRLHHHCAHLLSPKIPHGDLPLSEGEEEVILIQEHKCRRCEELGLGDADHRVRVHLLTAGANAGSAAAERLVHRVRAACVRTSTMFRFSPACFTSSIWLNCSIKSTCGVGSHTCEGWGPMAMNLRGVGSHGCPPSWYARAGD